jgi:cytochrome c553
MVEYVDDRQMPDEDIKDIAHYLEQIKLKTKLPPAGEQALGFDADARLLESKRLMQIPRAPGDTAAGGKIYHRECATCHGREGEGRADKAVPMLAGQYTSYL